MTGRVGASALVVLVACVGVVGACSGERETGGRMRAFDDTGLPPSPIEEGWMVALPAVDATWDLLDARPEGGHIERTAKIERGDVLGAGGVWQPLGAGGRFDLPVTPGEWAVCYLPNPNDVGPLGVAGCNVLQLEEGSRIEASWGENGFWAAVD
jgi:hypothetical protein